MKAEGARNDTSFVEVFRGLSLACVYLHVIQRFFYTQKPADSHFIQTPADVTKEHHEKAPSFLSIRAFLISFKLLQGFQIKRLLVLACR